MKAKQRIKLFVILGIEAIAIAVMLLLIFFAGKQVYTVTFDLNGGTLLSGDLVQMVTQGHNATAPSVTKEGCYFLKWSGSYSRVTHDVYVEAIWEYETTAGIEYNVDENSNYCTISGAFKGLQGDVYIGAYNGSKKVLGIEDGAFEGCDGITRIHLLDGILTIGENVFAGCTSLESIELPDTVVSLGKNAFLGCESLKAVTLPEKLKKIGDNVFEGCTALETVVSFDELKMIGEKAFAGCEKLSSITFPEGLTSIGARAFEDCTALKEITLPTTVLTVGSKAFDNAEATITLFAYEGEETSIPDTWASDWNGTAVVEWEFLPLPETETGEGEDSASGKEKGN